MITVEEFLKREDLPPDFLSGDDITYAMTNFAKLHVEAALKAAAEENYPSTKANFKLVNNKILKAYPLENIK